jgi:PEP-CTERM motif
MKMIRCGFAVLVLSGCIGSANAGLITTYTDRTTWEANVTGTITTDPFDNDIGDPSVSGPPIEFDSGVLSEGNNKSGEQCNYVDTGIYVGCVGLDGDTIKWTLPGVGNAFGFDLPGLSVPLSITIMYDGFPDAVVTTPTSGFFGLVSDGMSFNMITFTEGLRFTIDNLSFNHAVPLPSTLALFALGLLALCRRINNQTEIRN